MLETFTFNAERFCDDTFANMWLLTMHDEMYSYTITYQDTKT